MQNCDIESNGKRDNCKILKTIYQNGIGGKEKKKVISALLCAAMIATMLVGCGGSSNDSKSSGGDGKKLVYWAMWSKDEPQAKVIQDADCKVIQKIQV